MSVAGTIRQGDRLVDGTGPLAKRYVVRKLEDRPGGKLVVHLAQEAEPTKTYVQLNEGQLRSRLNRDALYDRRDGGG